MLPLCSYEDLHSQMARVLDCSLEVSKFELYTEREDGLDTSSLWSPQRNCHSNNDAQ